jgi:hypothetical protein
MAIKNKDGTVYKINGPNPLLKEQDNFKNFVLHNFKWEPEVHEKKQPKIEIPKIEEKVPEVSKAPETPKIPEIEIEEKIQVVEKLKSKETSPNNPNVTRVHCLPAKIEKRIDDLYGEIKTINTWGDPFLFESVIIGQNDFMIEFWTNIEIETNSIVYPANRDKRWWKINKKKEKEEGYLYNAIPSNIHPDFT